MRRPAERRHGSQRGPRPRSRQREEETHRRRVHQREQHADRDHRFAEEPEERRVQVEGRRGVAGVEVDVGELAVKGARDLQEDEPLVLEQDAVVHEGREVCGRDGGDEVRRGPAHAAAGPAHTRTIGANRSTRSRQASTNSGGVPTCPRR